ncbi:MAG: hypothetical protein ACOCVN_02950 [bacterium]
MKKGNLLKYMIAPYNAISAIFVLFFLGKGFWYPDPSEGLLTFIFKIFIFFVYIVFLLTNISFWLNKNDYNSFSLKYNFWVQVFQSFTFRLFGIIFNIGAGAELIIYGIYNQSFSFGIEYKLWNYVLTLVYYLDDRSTIVLGFNIVSIVIAIFFYKLIMVEKNKKQTV